MSRLYHHIEVNISKITADLACKSSTEIFWNNINLLDYLKIDYLFPLIIKRSSVRNNSNALSYQKMVKTLHFIQHDSHIPIATEGENIVNIDSVGTTKMSGVDHNSSSPEYSVSDSKDSVDFDSKYSVHYKIDHNCPMEVDANINGHTSNAINHESNIEEDESPLDKFRCGTNETTLIDTSHDNNFLTIAPDENS